MRIRWQPHTRGNRRNERVGLEFGSSCDDLTTRPDDARYAVVGGPHHEALGLDGTHAGDLKMLVASRGVAEPGVIGDIDERVRLAQDLKLGAAISVLVADGRSKLQARCRQWRLVYRAAREILIGQIGKPQ